MNMIFTVQILVVLLMTSQFINAYPSAFYKGHKNIYPMNLRFKRDYGYLQHHDSGSNINDDTPASYDESLPYLYSLYQRQYQKRLIDF